MTTQTAETLDPTETTTQSRWLGAGAAEDPGTTGDDPGDVGGKSVTGTTTAGGNQNTIACDSPMVPSADGTTCVNPSGGKGGGGQQNNPPVNNPPANLVAPSKGLPMWAKWGLGLLAVGGLGYFGYMMYQRREAAAVTEAMAAEASKRRPRKRARKRGHKRAKK